MAIGKSVGSKIDRSGSTFASRREAIKAASKVAAREIQAFTDKPVSEGFSDETGKSFIARAAASSRFGKGFKDK